MNHPDSIFGNLLSPQTRRQVARMKDRMRKFISDECTRVDEWRRGAGDETSEGDNLVFLQRYQAKNYL